MKGQEDDLSEGEEVLGIEGGKVRKVGRKGGLQEEEEEDDETRLISNICVR